MTYLALLNQSRNSIVFQFWTVANREQRVFLRENLQSRNFMVPALIRTPYLDAKTRLTSWASFVFFICSSASCESHQPMYLLGNLT
jgi:hypothetical protein